VKKLRFDITYERDRHTYKQTDTHTPHDGIGRACKASRGKNRKHICDFLLTKNTNYGRRIRRSGWADIFILLIFIYLFSSDRDLGDAALYTFVTSLQDDYDVVKSDNDTLNRGVIQKVLTNTSFFWENRKWSSYLWDAMRKSHIATFSESEVRVGATHKLYCRERTAQTVETDLVLCGRLLTAVNVGDVSVGSSTCRRLLLVLNLLVYTQIGDASFQLRHLTSESLHVQYKFTACTRHSVNVNVRQSDRLTEEAGDDDAESDEARDQCERHTLPCTTTTLTTTTMTKMRIVLMMFDDVHTQTCQRRRLTAAHHHRTTCRHDMHRMKQTDRQTDRRTEIATTTQRNSDTNMTL